MTAGRLRIFTIGYEKTTQPELIAAVASDAEVIDLFA